MVDKARKTARAIGPLLPKIKRPKTNKRKVLYSTVQSIIIYAAPICCDGMEVEKYKNSVKSLQRLMALHIHYSFLGGVNGNCENNPTVSTGGRTENKLRQKERDNGEHNNRETRTQLKNGNRSGEQPIR